MTSGYKFFTIPPDLRFQRTGLTASAKKMVPAADVTMLKQETSMNRSAYCQKKVWHLIFIYIYIHIYIYYNRIIYSYIYIIIWISIISAGSLSKTLDVTILGSMRQQRNFLVLPIAFTCEAMNALAYVYMFVIHVSTVAFRFGPNCLSMHIWYALWVCFLETATVTYYLQSILGNQRWYRPQPQPTDLYIENKSTIWMLIQMIGYDSTHIWYVELCRYIWKPEPQ